MAISSRIRVDDLGAAIANGPDGDRFDAYGRGARVPSAGEDPEDGGFL
jgi:hypothetical protein